MGIPSAGRSVTLSSGFTDAPGASRKRNRWAMVASNSVASIMANVLPMQRRGPPPNGK